MPFNYLQYQRLAWTPPPPTVDPSNNPSSYYPPFSEPRGTTFGKVIAGAFIAGIAAGPFIPPSGFEQPTADRYGAVWSEPVRLDQRTHLVTAAQQFTAFQLDAAQQPENVTESRWHYPWSEPVRLPKGLGAYLHPQPVWDFTDTFLPKNNPTWFGWLSEPVRQKIGLGAYLQQFDPQQVPLQPSGATLLQGWFNWLSEPVREPVGLKTWLQQTTAYHPRILPNPDVTGTMNGIETNEDVALFGVNVYDGSAATGGATSANVSIAEIQARNSGFGSIEES